MKHILILFTVLVSATTTSASVVCRNGPVNSIAKQTCTDEVGKYGAFVRIAEGYGRIGFNQYTRFCMAMTDGQVCDCNFSFLGSPYTGPKVRCVIPDRWYNFKDCVQSMREDCAR